MKNLGDFRVGETIRGTFNTRKADGTPITLAGTPALSVYKSNSTTETTTGVSSITVDFDSRTGLHFYSIDTSADGTFYSTATDFRVVLTAGTVDSISVVGVEVGSFSIENRSALRPTVAGRTLDVSAGGEAGIDLANVGSPTTALNLSGTTISTSQAVGSVTGAVGSVTGNVGGNVTGSVGSIATGGISASSIASAALNGKGDWNIGKTGYALSSAGVQAIWDALTSALTTVGSIGKLLVDNINATISSRSTYSGGDTSGTTTLLTRIVGTLASGTHNAQSGDAFARLGAPSGASISADIQTRLATSGYTAPPSAATIAAAVWDLTVSGHTTSGTFGAAMNAAGSAGDPWSTSLPGSYGAGTAGFIVGTNLNAQVSSRLATASYTSPPSASTISSQVAADLATAHGAGSWSTATGFSTLDASGVRTAIGLASANLDTQLIPVSRLGGMLVQDGLVYQFTANALELGPQGSGGGGGGDATLAKQNEILALLGTGSAISHSPVSSNGEIEYGVVRGDDYLLASGRAFQWDVDPPAGFTAAQASCWFGGYKLGRGSWLVEGTIEEVTVDSVAKWRLKFQPRKADTVDCVPDQNYYFSVEVRGPNERITRVWGFTEVLDSRTLPE